MNSDLQQLLENLQTGMSDLCCFNNYDITTEYVDFETNEDPAAAAQNIFVSFCICYSNAMYTFVFFLIVLISE